jgi:hypothetical protein
MKRIYFIMMLVCMLFFILSCVSAPPPQEKDDKDNKTEESSQEYPDEKEYPGGGKSTSLAEAMLLAKVSAVRKAVQDMIGREKEEANKAKLDDILYSSRYVNGFVEMIERTRKDKVGDDYVYEGRYMVKLKAVAGTLEAHGIMGDGGEVHVADHTADDDMIIEEDDEEDREPITDDEVYEKITRDEEKYIKRYIDKMTFLVYFSEENVTEDPQFIKGAVTIANDYLISNGRTAIDLVQAEKLKEDNQLVYEEETGGMISIVQWIAQKLNADVYIEISGETQGKTEPGGKYYGVANVQTKAFQASTGELVGSVAYNQLEMKASFSKISQKDAQLKAIQGVVYSKIMPQIFRQINDNMVDKITKLGIRYEVVIQYPPNDRVMNKLWKKMERDIKSRDLVYQTEDEIKYAVYYIGDIEDLKNAFYDATETVAGLEEMYAVLVRGKTITFNTGL